MYFIVINFSYDTTADSSAFRGNIQLVPMPDSYDLDRGLFFSVQAIQVIIIVKQVKKPHISVNLLSK